jgi:O-antigen/teichoic acid export membrane protein
VNEMRRTARNVSIVGSSQLLMWLATVLFTIAQAHLLGPARFGQLSLALSYAMFLLVAIDFGLGIQLTRMVAQRTGPGVGLGATIVARFTLWLAATPVLLVATAAFGYDAELRITIAVLAIATLLVGVSSAIESYLRGHERFVLPSAAAVAYRVVAALVGVGVLLLGHGLLGVAAAFLAGAVAYLAVMLVGLRGEDPIDIRSGATAAFPLLRAVVPLGLWWVIGTFAFNVDMVIVERLLPDENVGWYAAAFRLFTVATIVPTLVVASVLSPVLARLSLGPREELGRVLDRALLVLVASGALVSLAFAVFAGPIVALLYPYDAYGPAADALRLLAPRVLLLYVSSVLMYTLVALHQERRLLVLVCLFALLNPLANLVAIPLLAQNGAALVSSLTELVWLFCLLRMMPADLMRVRHRPAVIATRRGEGLVAAREEVA